MLQTLHYDIDNEVAKNILGVNDRNLSILSELYGFDINYRDGDFMCDTSKDLGNLKAHLNALIKVAQNSMIDEIMLRTTYDGTLSQSKDIYKAIGYTASLKPIRLKTVGQADYYNAVRDNDIVFAIGPAGTGKTYLAVVMAVNALKNNEIKRIVLTRPAVEAGESLGFLPGDLKEKVDPYLTPLYDALYELLGQEKTDSYIERKIIEVAPLAFMRGRTLNDAYILLDEAQNTSSSQMKMFLTRLGNNSKMIISGDVTQIDISLKGTFNGLIEASELLSDLDGIGVVYLSNRDIVRNPLVSKILKKYDGKK
ncbi:MAG: PhoH family protein [Erysipelotrichaceae bacterium]|nr:PhoH family protein [Erysipelotrichaceae bacterium]